MVIISIECTAFIDYVVRGYFRTVFDETWLHGPRIGYDSLRFLLKHGDELDIHD